MVPLLSFGPARAGLIGRSNPLPGTTADGHGRPATTPLNDQRDSASRRDETWKKLRKRCRKSADLDVFPEADAVCDRLHFRAWTLIQALRG
jgi:hypothetical protein